jgi:hypothetical protein
MIPQALSRIFVTAMKRFIDFTLTVPCIWFCGAIIVWALVTGRVGAEPACWRVE